MKKAIGAGISTVLVIGIITILINVKSAEQQAVVINDVNIPVEVVETPEAQALGLSNRESLPSGSGMLFVLSEPRVPIFWMKDMRFSIDIIWISEDKKVVGIEPSINPSTYPQTFSSKVPVGYVLEVNAGFAEAQGIKEGNSVAF